MPNFEKKQEVIQEIRDKVTKSVSMVLVDARGLTVLQDTKLRKILREAGVDYKVYKNTMINFAIKDTDSEGLAPYLEGPTTVAFSYDEATKAANLINKQLKDMPNLEFKAGVVEGVLYDAQGMIAIADIPSREVLLSRLLGSLKSPVSSFARVLNALAEEMDKNPNIGAAAEATVAAETPEVAEAAETPEAPEAVETAETIEAPETAEMTEAPEASETAEATETVEAPEAIEAVETPEAPEAVEAVETPEAPEAVEAVETPEAPEAVEAAETPEEAEAVEAAEAPETPEAAETPEPEETV